MEILCRICVGLELYLCGVRLVFDNSRPARANNVNVLLILADRIGSVV